jgi:ketopantoate reductase
MEEALVVARRSGFPVVEAQARLRNVLQQAATTHPRFTSSMSRDFQAARPTELEWLTGKIVRLADGLDLPVAIHRTLYAVLKLKAHRIGQAPEMAPITAPARS